MMLALEERFEQGDILFGGGIEATIGALVVLEALGTEAQELLCGSRIVGHGEGAEVVMVGRASDLREAMQAGDALGHRKPADDPFAFSSAVTADEETVGMVDDGFDAQDHAELVVHLDPVSADTVLDPHALGTGFEVLEDFCLEVTGELFAEEAQDVLGAEAQKRVFDQLAVQRAERFTALEEDVGGEFGLINRPVVLVLLEQGTEQGVDLAGELAH